MHRPADPMREEEQRRDRLEDAGLALAALRRSVARGDRLAIETFCLSFTRRLAAAAIDGDDEDEIRATIELIAARLKFGIHQRLRKFLLPLVAAAEVQLEEAEKEQ